VARSLDQILAELNPQYATSENILNTRLNAIPGEIDSGIAQTDAKLAQANSNILSSAQRRGTGTAFGGIPLGDQAKYAATEYAPAIANLRATGAQKELSLQESLAGLAREKRGQAQSIYDTGVSQDLAERGFQEQIRQFNEQQAAANRAAAAQAKQYSFANAASQQTAAKTPRSVQTKPGSFAFYDEADKPISAAQYALKTNQNIGDVLYDMGQAGDQDAQQIYTLLQREAKNNDGGKGYQAALKQLAVRKPYLLGGF